MSTPDKTILPATLDSLGVIRKYVRDAASSAALDTTASYNLQLAVDEIATNIIVHGYMEANLTGDMVIYTELTDKLLRIVLEDSGVTFDPRTLKLPDEEALSKPLEERSIGGLGVYLAFNGVDRFDYEQAGKQNRNIFEVFLN